MSLRYRFFQNAKNAFGPRTHRKLLVFDVDDYGNVRLHSRQAVDNLDRAGLKPRSRYDQFDTLETNDDLDALFEVLRSVTDRNGRSAMFTAYSLPANINFEAMADNGLQKYVYELLPETLRKLGPDYNRVMDYWRQGMADGLLHPEFHGREHFHIRLLMEKLKSEDPELAVCFENRSLARLSSGPLKNIKWTSAFDFESFDENRQHAETVVDGIEAFAKVFGVRPKVFCSPGSSNHSTLYETAIQQGIKFVETSSIFQLEHQGGGRYKRRFNYLGKRVGNTGRLIVRNCVFEPTEPKPFDWVAYTLQQVESAFYWKKPAIISSHRVNFCGHIDEKNRQFGLQRLQELLHQIVRRWPDVEFMSTPEMAAAVGF
jgi:hypothetical protein